MQRLRDLSRPLVLGLICGLALALGRAPLGFDLASTPAVSAADAMAWRAFALAGVAVALGRFAGSRPNLIAIFLGAAAAFLAHGALAADTWRFEGGSGPFFVFALCLLGAWVVRPRDPALLGPVEQDRLGLLERVSLLAAGAGVAITLEAAARPLRLLGGGSSLDDSVFAGCFLLLFALGAAAFGPLVPRRARAGLCALGLALGALACLESLRPLEAWSSRDGLDAFFRHDRWKLDLSHQGRLSGDGLIAARIWILPAFALGAAGFCATRGARLAWVVFGAALALALLPALLAATPGTEPADAPALRVALGASLAALGGAGAAWGAREASRGLRASCALACLACAAVAIFAPRARVLPISPWERFQVQPYLVLDTAGGLITLEPTLDMGRVVTLDRRRMSPSPSGEQADEQRLRLAWERVDPAALAGDERRVLLIGQLTPHRASVLRDLGATHIDRSAAWHLLMPRLEEELFEDEELPAGRVLAPRELPDAGPWALIVAPPVEGDVPVVRAEDRDQGPRMVWCSTDSACVQRGWGDFVRLSSAGMDEICIAPFQPAGFPAGGPQRGEAPWRRLHARPFERRTAARAETLARLGEAAQGSPQAALAEGLALHAAAQVRSSPFESDAQQVEIDERSIELLWEAALAREPDRFLRELWNGLAVILSEKRELELVDRFVTSLAERWAPWWELELVVARNDLEMLDPDAAGDRLLRLVEQRPLDLTLRLTCGRALAMAGRPAEAVQQFEAIEAVQPGRRDVRRPMAMELARLGDPRASSLLEELLRDDPEDEELRQFLGSGPFPPPPTLFEPFETAGDEHEH
jgi:hypothetical protein